jgi:hypothetical protein
MVTNNYDAQLDAIDPTIHNFSKLNCLDCNLV